MVGGVNNILQFWEPNKIGLHFRKKIGSKNKEVLEV